MIISLLNSRYRLTWLIFHIVIGIIAVFNNIYVIVWFYFILAGSFYLLSSEKINRPLMLACTMVYIGGFELIARMTKCSPIIPWEASKYIFTLLSLTGILLSMNKPGRYFIGYVIILLALPALFIDESAVTGLNDIIFNVMGIINIGLGMIFFSKLSISKDRFYSMLRLMVFPCITVLTYTFIKTPDLKDISFSLGAQTSTSGDFGSNQVSTILGLGFFLMSVACIMNWKYSANRLTDGMLATGFFIQGLFTFSRGGMIGASAALLIFIYFLLHKSNQKIVLPFKIKQYIIPVLGLLLITMIVANNLTDGRLLLRYQGETQGTVMGTREKDLNTMTSSRNIIFLSDLELWWEYPLLGAGVGTSKYIRSEGRGIAAHVEVSRLLAEHGIPGLLIFLLILYSGYRYLKEKDHMVKAVKLALFTLAIITTFHSATRTFITPILLSICSLVVVTSPGNIGPQNVDDSLPGK